MRSLRGRDQEKVVKKKEELWGRRAGRRVGVALHSLSLHCDPWPPTRALSALTWETWWPRWKVIFLYCGDHVCNNTNRESDRPLETFSFFFFLFYFGYFDGYFWQAGNTPTYFFPLFLPKHCDCVCESYTLYCIYAILTPSCAVVGGCDWLTPRVEAGDGGDGGEGSRGS